MKKYYRIMLGRNSVHAGECLSGNFIGADFGVEDDLTNRLPEDWKIFNKEFIPVWQKKFPERSKISAGLACGALWTIAKGIQNGDIVLCPNGSGEYLVGEVLDHYSYHPKEVLPHRRTVKWLPTTIQRTEMSDGMRNSTGSIGTVSDITKYTEEIEKLIKGLAPQPIITTDPIIENPYLFAMEKHLEEFLVANWNQTELGKNYDIYIDNDNDLTGRQCSTPVGIIDILAISKDKKEILVIELKRGRASDNVVGQTLRYMGWAIETLAANDQSVKGAIIALEDDAYMRSALKAVSNIDLFLYKVSFDLIKKNS